jgi:hypothetical protein
MLQDRYHVHYHNLLPLEQQGVSLFRNLIYNDTTLKANTTSAVLTMIDQVADKSRDIIVLF